MGGKGGEVFIKILLLKALICGPSVCGREVFRKVCWHIVWYESGVETGNIGSNVPAKREKGTPIRSSFI